MPAELTIEFWFSIASTYTYLSATRLSAVRLIAAIAELPENRRRSVA
jgi:hypothetical protein